MSGVYNWQMACVTTTTQWYTCTQTKVGKAFNDKPWQNNNADRDGFFNKPRSEGALAHERLAADVK